MTVIKYIKYYVSKLKKDFFVIFFVILMSVFFELFGISVFIPLFSKDDTGIPFFDNFFKYYNINKSTLNICIIILSAFFIKFLAIAYQNKKLFTITNNLLYSIRKDLYEKTFLLDYLCFTKYNKGHLHNLITKESERYSAASKYLIESLVSACYAFVYLIFIININPAVFYISLAVGIMFLFIIKKITRLIKGQSHNITALNNMINDYVSETLSAFKYFKATGRTKKILRHFDKKNYAQKEINTSMQFRMAVSRALMEPVGVAFVVIIILFNSYYNFTTNVQVFLIAFLFYRAFSRISEVQLKLQNFYSTIGSIDKIIDYEENIRSNAEKHNGDIEIVNIESMTLNNLNFSIFNKQILKNMNLNISEGLNVIIGESGSGKTTLINLLSSLYLSKDYYINNHQIDKIDIRKLREKIGYISQEVVIFNDTFKNNLTMWEKIDEDKIMEVVRSVRLEDFYKECGPDFMIENGGLNLSGGQRQRLVIARELLKEPDIMFVDEATSSLDVDTEEQVFSIIKELSRNIKVIFVTHRLSILKDADKIIILEHGSKITEGTFNELAVNEKYSKYITGKS